MDMKKSLVVGLGGSLCFHLLAASALYYWTWPGDTAQTSPKPYKIILSQIVIPPKPLPCTTPPVTRCMPPPSHKSLPPQSGVAAPVVSRTPLANAVEAPAVADKAAPPATVPQPASPPSIHAAPVVAAPSRPVTVSTPEFNADYLDNPKPIYPRISQKLGEEGKVVLHVLVSAQGAPLEIEVKSSSGFERLDRAAEDAAKRWRFVPAKKGDESVEGWVNIPLVFRLGT